MNEQAAAPTTTPSPLRAALSAIATGQKAATAYERPDLAKRLGASARRLADPAFHLLVVGEFKQGKSSLVNSLVGRQVCPVDDDIATAVPTLVRWAEQPTAAVLRQPEVEPDPEAAGAPPPVREEITIDRVVEFASERHARNADRIHSVEIGVPSKLLAGGLVLVDTPGVGGLGSAHGAVTIGALPMAEAMIFVTDAGQEFTAPELEFLQTARRLCPNMICLLTKTDFYPAWRKILDLDIGHLRRLGIDAPVMAISSTLHDRAMQAFDGGLDTESGIPNLVKHLRREVLGNAVGLSVAAAKHDLLDVYGQMIDHFQTRKVTLDDPESARVKISELERAKERADDLKSRSARWQQTLSDGIQDLNTDVDHDLRARFRQINEESDAALDAADPADLWPEFEQWLQHRTAVELAQNYEFMHDRARQLAELVADHFEADSGSAQPQLDILDPTAALSRVAPKDSFGSGKMGLSQQAMTGLRGGYSGMLMFGALGSVVGLALGPIGIGLGVVMGRKQVSDEKARQLGQRRSQARSTQRKYMDDATFIASKDSRDTLRNIQRQLRDFFTERAQEQATSIQETLVALQSAVQADQQERQRQSAFVNDALGKLLNARNQLDQLTAPAPAVAQPGTPR